MSEIEEREATNSERTWLGRHDELDIGRAIDATLLGVLLLIKQLVTTLVDVLFRPAFVGRPIADTKGSELAPSAERYARPITFAVILVIASVMAHAVVQLTKSQHGAASITPNAAPPQGAAKWFEIIGKGLSEGGVLGLFNALFPIVFALAIFSCMLWVAARVLRLNLDYYAALQTTCYLAGALAALTFLPVVLRTLQYLVTGNPFGPAWLTRCRIGIQVAITLLWPAVRAVQMLQRHSDRAWWKAALAVPLWIGGTAVVLFLVERLYENLWRGL